MVRERDVVEIVFKIVGIERRKAAVAALHALDPLAAARDRLVVFIAAIVAAYPVHRHDHDSGIIEIGIVGVGVLERPSARPHVRTFHGPVTLENELLLRKQPVEALAGVVQRLRPAGLEQRVTGQRGIPDRRYAGLAVGLILSDHQKPVEFRALSPRAAGAPAETPALRTSSPRWPSAGRSRRGRPRR